MSIQKAPDDVFKKGTYSRRADTLKGRQHFNLKSSETIRKAPDQVTVKEGTRYAETIRVRQPQNPALLLTNSSRSRALILVLSPSARRPIQGALTDQKHQHLKHCPCSSPPVIIFSRLLEDSTICTHTALACVSTRPPMQLLLLGQG